MTLEKYRQDFSFGKNIEPTKLRLKKINTSACKNE